MIMALLPGSTGPVYLVDGNATTYVPITQPFPSTGLQKVGAMVELDPDISGANVEAKACYRVWGTDDSQSAGPWNAFGNAVSPSGNMKLYVSSTGVASASGLLVQLGVELTVTGAPPTARHARAYLRFPVAHY